MEMSKEKIKMMYTYVARMQKKDLPTPQNGGIFYATVVGLYRNDYYRI